MSNINTQFTVERSDCSNINELIELSKTYYKDRDVGDFNYLEWQYLQNPAGKAYLFTAREDFSGELAGQYIVIPITFNREGEKIAGSIALNLLTNPKYQRNGLFPRMVSATHNECAEKNVLFTIGMPNHQSYPGLTNKLGFKHLGDIPLLIKPLSLTNIFSSFLKRKSKEKHGGIIKLLIPDIKNIKLLDFNNSEDVDKINDFWQKAKKNYLISTNKEFSFFKWRYNDLPTREYHVLYYEKNNSISGIIVLKAEKIWGFNVGMIMDFMVLDNNFKVGRQLLRFVKNICKNESLDFITILHTNNYEYRILKKNGYLKIPYKLLLQKTHFIVRMNKDFLGSDSIFSLNKWKLTFGDYDIF
ncbi:MAG: GNAT family N-acetyltransferase [Lentimicrobiaceae bacterium]|nr:GNAT family N-acetyltransferase [Lentimicrobiaceae bacterium]